jgi:fucose permease
MDNHIPIPLTDRKLLFVISRKRSVFAVLLHYIIRWISPHEIANKFTFYMACAEFFALSSGTGLINWRFHFAEL